MTRLKRKKELPGKTSGDIRFGTPSEVAQYRASRICNDVDTVIEVGAGAGFQTAAFAARAKRVIAIDIDEERLSRAEFPEHVIPIAGDALDPAVIARVKSLVQGACVVFLDPQRPGESRARTLAEISPDIPLFIKAYSTITMNIAIELPPFLSDLSFSCEREYLSIDGELNRLTIYLGELKRADVGVVTLPSGERISHDASLPELVPRKVEAKFVLDPDRALEHAGLTPLVLPSEYDILELGKRYAYLTKEAPKAWFSVYEILGSGSREEIARLLEQSDCGSIILHGSMTQEEQKDTLRSLKRHCFGERRLHIFTGDRWLLTERKERKA